jgi:hypothetical protein
MGAEETLGSPDRAMPLCLHCLEPYEPLVQHYCPKCGNAVGQLTPNIPFVNIPFEFEFWGRLWKAVWSPRQGRYIFRVMALVLFVSFFWPILLVGMPLILFARKGSSGSGQGANGGQQAPFSSETLRTRDGAEFPEYPDDATEPEE